MKLLLDANISWRLTELIKDIFPGSVHVDKVELNIPAKDIEIWNFAKENDFIILTNDDDFFELSVFNSFPPKVIILRTGNLRTKYLLNLLQNHFVEIQDFSISGEYGILEIY